MSTPQKSSHWKSLAALLGTEQAGEIEPAAPAPPVPMPVAPSVQEKKPSPPSPPPPPAPSREAPRKQAPPKRGSHWGKLANVLGLGGAVEPEEPEAELPVTQHLPTKPTAIPPAAQTSDAAAMAASHWDTPERDMEGSIDPLEMIAEPFVDEALDAVDLDAIASSPTRDEQADDERRRRRRRRRGRGRGRQSERGAPAGTDRTGEPGEESPIVAADAATDADVETEDFESSPAADQGEGPEQPSDGGEEGQRRRRRRRRGRRGRRDEGEMGSDRSESRPSAGDADVSDSSARGQKADPRKRSETSSRQDVDLDLLDEDDGMAGLDRDDDDGGDDSDERGDDSQLSHKKIPSWYEAIESVIATNMASRASHPSSGSRNRGRGRRDR